MDKIFLYLFSIFIYLLTISPTISGGDSGELSSCCYLLSIAHPTGYPLYTLLGKLFTLIPAGNIAFRINFFSAFFSSLTVIIIYELIRTILKRYLKLYFPLPVFFSTLLFTFSPVFWYQSLITEVYSLNIFFLSILILILIKWVSNDKPDSKILYLFAFFYGISFSHYFLIITFLPFFIYFIYKNNKSFLNIVFLIFLFILGAIFYLYIPLRSTTSYPFSRFSAHNFSSFLDFITANGFKEISLDLERYKEILPNLTFYFLSQFSILGIIVFLYGIYKLYKIEFSLFTLFILLIITNLIFSFPASFSFDIESFLVPTYFLITIVISIGLSLIYQKKIGKIFLYIFTIYFILISLQRFPLIDQSKNKVLYNYAKEVFKEIPKNSVLIASNSSTLFSFIFLYLQNVEEIRKDIILIYPMYVRSSRYIEYLKEKHPALEINKRIIELSTLRGEKSKNILHSEFWRFYYSRHPFMRLSNIISGGGVTEGISNHYRCFYIDEEIINLNIEKFNIYLLNNEIYETSGIELQKNYVLIPHNCVFEIVKKEDYKKYGFSKIGEECLKIPEFYDELSKEVFQNIYLERAKANYRLGKSYLREWNKALKLNPKISKKGLKKILQENYRGISDRAVGEFLSFKNGDI